MNGNIRRVLQHRLGWALALCSFLAVPLPASAEGAREGFDQSAGNLIAVLRESRGDNKKHESMEPYGTVKVKLDTGREIDVEPSWFRYIGDMHVRLVFEGGQMLQSASPDDLRRLKLSPEEALKIGIDNLKRRYGQPVATAWSGGMMQIEGGATDLISSYFLDREFWRGVQASYPQGVVVAVPRRGGLVYAPASDENAVDSLRFSAAVMYSGGPGARLSSALYLFKDGQWSVFQAPMAVAHQ